MRIPYGILAIHVPCGIMDYPYYIWSMDNPSSIWRMDYPYPYGKTIFKKVTLSLSLPRWSGVCQIAVICFAALRHLWGSKALCTTMRKMSCTRIIRWERDLYHHRMYTCSFSCISLRWHGMASIRFDTLMLNASLLFIDVSSYLISSHNYHQLSNRAMS